MAIAFVQSKSAANTSTTASVTLNAGATAGDLIVVYIPVDSVGTISTPAGFTQIGTLASGGSGPSARMGALFYIIAVGGETTISSTVTSGQWRMIASEYSGVDTAAPLVTSGNVIELNAGGGGTAYTTSSVTPTAGVQCVAVFGWATATATIGWSAEALTGSNVGTVTEREDTATRAGCLADALISSTTGSYSGSATSAASGKVGTDFLALFKAATAVATPRPPSSIPFMSSGRI